MAQGHQRHQPLSHAATPARDGSDQTGIAERCQGEIGKNHLGPIDANIKIEFLKYATLQHIQYDCDRQHPKQT